jgi:hypothetical protein
MPVLRVLLGLARRLHTRHKFAALGALGMLMVATPWVGVMREQAREIEAILGAQAALDPVARAVDVKRALLAHRAPAARVLRGQRGAEPERLERQREADHRIDELASTLQRGRFVPALEEHAALRHDWAELLTQVAARSLNAHGSDAAHDLLVEQALQIIDLVSLVAAPMTGSDTVVEHRLAIRTVPSLEVAVLALESARVDTDPAARVAALARLRSVAALVQRRFAADRHLRPVGARAGEERDAPRWQQARRVAQDALADYAAAVASAEPGRSSESAPAVEQKAAATMTALRHWAEAERTALATSLDVALARQRVERRDAGIALAATLALWLVALAWLWPRRPPLAGADPMAASGSTQPGSESKRAARRLLRRLQQPESDTETPTHY